MTQIWPKYDTWVIFGSYLGHICVICGSYLGHLWVVFENIFETYLGHILVIGLLIIFGGFWPSEIVQIRRPENASTGSQPLVRPPSGNSMVCHRIPDLLSRWSFLFYSVPGAGCINSNIWPTKKQQGGAHREAKTDQLLNPTLGHGKPIWPIIESIIQPHFGPRGKNNIWQTKYNIGQTKNNIGVLPNEGNYDLLLDPIPGHGKTNDLLLDSSLNPLFPYVLLGWPKFGLSILQFYDVLLGWPIIEPPYCRTYF